MPLSDYLAHYGGGAAHGFPDIAGRYRGRGLLVIADGHCVWDDLEAFGCRSDEQRGGIVAPKDWDILTVNAIVTVFPGRIEHCYSNEPQWLHRYIEARRPEYKREFPGPNHTHSINRGARHRWPFGGHGTSGLGGVLVGLGLGYDPVVICGMPLDNGPHNGEPPWRKCRFEIAEVANQRNGAMPMHWKIAMENAFDGKVKSMSGRTREWLGAPECRT